MQGLEIRIVGKNQDEVLRVLHKAILDNQFRDDNAYMERYSPHVEIDYTFVINPPSSFLDENWKDLKVGVVNS